MRASSRVWCSHDDAGDPAVGGLREAHPERCRPVGGPGPRSAGGVPEYPGCGAYPRDHPHPARVSFGIVRRGGTIPGATRVTACRLIVPRGVAVPGVSVRSPSRRSLCTLQRPPAEIRAEVPGWSIWTRYWEWGAGHERGRLLKRIRTIDALGPALGERCAFASRWRPAGGSVQSTLTRLVSARGRRATQIRRASSARRNIVPHGDQGPQMRVSASHR